MNAEVAALLWKETRQIPRKRSAAITAVALPLLFFVVFPVANMLALRSGGMSGPVGVNVPTGFGHLPSDPVALLRDFTLPLFVTLGGLIIPSTTATYTIIGERERHTLELLVALPLTLGQIILAKLLAVLLLGAAVAVPLFLIDAVVMIALGIASWVDTLGLFFILIAALIYSTASALLVSLLAADFRTANNINGGLLGPTVILVLGAMMLLPAGPQRSLLLGVAFLALAVVLTIVAVRHLTVERFLR